MIDLMKFDSIVVYKNVKYTTIEKLVLLPLNEMQYILLINARTEKLDVIFNIDKYKFTHNNVIFACKDFNNKDLNTQLQVGKTHKTIKTLIEQDIIKNEGAQMILPHRYIKETNQIDKPEDGRDLRITFDAVESFNYCLGRIGNPQYFVVIKFNENKYVK